MNTTPNTSITSVSGLDGMDAVALPEGEPVSTEDINHMANEAAQAQDGFVHVDAPFQAAEYVGGDGLEEDEEDDHFYHGRQPENYEIEDNTTILAISAADVLRFRYLMLNPGEPLPEPEDIDPRDIRIAIETVSELNDIDANMRVKIVPDNETKYLDWSGQIPIPRSVMLVYKATMFNLHREGDKIAAWGSKWKGWAFAFMAYGGLMTLAFLVK